MRSNGLTAASYRPVADLNPSIAETLLVELREIGVAAYCHPVGAESMAALDRPEFQVEVLVRLYVDAAETDRAMQLLSSRDPHLLRANEDLTWAQIVAGYDAPLAGQVAPWPVYEDVDVAVSDESPAAVASAEDADPASDAWEARIRQRGSRFEEPAFEDRFVPPHPPPLPRLSPTDNVSWLGVVGGPTVLLAAAIFKLALPTWVTLFAALAFIGGFVSLVIRMGNGEDRLDDPDDGAQV